MCGGEEAGVGSKRVSSQPPALPSNGSLVHLPVVLMSVMAAGAAGVRRNLLIPGAAASSPLVQLLPPSDPDPALMGRAL